MEYERRNAQWVRPFGCVKRELLGDRLCITSTAFAIRVMMACLYPPGMTGYSHLTSSVTAVEDRVHCWTKPEASRYELTTAM